MKTSSSSAKLIVKPLAYAISKKNYDSILKSFAWFSFITSTFLIAWISISGIQKTQINPLSVETVWQQKPILSYYALTPNIQKDLSNETSLSSSQLQIITQIALLQRKQLLSLEEETLPIIQNTNLSLFQKQSMIAGMGYNQEIEKIITTSQNHLRMVIDKPSFNHLIDWGNSRWQVERQLHGISSTSGFPREFRIYTGQYDSLGAYYAALPDHCLKKANRNETTCDQYGYIAGQYYDIYVSYQGEGVAVRVGDAGPSNNDDNYWATTMDPTPRRMFTDLPLGMPEAQAAYFDNYNEGKDQYGREVIFPTGVELSRLVAKDIGLAPDTYDWVKVAYIWTADWEDPVIEETLETSEAVIQPVQISTAQANGSIIHEVQVGESPLAIAEAYGLSMEELLEINELTIQFVLQPGNELIIKASDRTAIPSWKLTATHQPQSTQTKKPTHTPQPALTASNSPTTQIANFEATEAQINQETNRSNGNTIVNALKGINPWYFIIGFFVFLGISLAAAGSILNRKE